MLRVESRFSDAAGIWKAKIVERREDSTADIYSYWLDTLVLPQLGELRLSECDVAQMDAFFSRLERARRVVEHKDGSTSEKPRYSASTRRTIRSIVGGIMQQAVLHQAVASNPIRELERIESPKGHRKAPPRGLTAEERRPLRAYEFHSKHPCVGACQSPLAEAVAAQKGGPGAKRRRTPRRDRQRPHRHLLGLTGLPDPRRPQSIPRALPPRSTAEEVEPGCRGTILAA
jgi:hypothetical protein